MSISTLSLKLQVSVYTSPLSRHVLHRIFFSHPHLIKHIDIGTRLGQLSSPDEESQARMVLSSFICIATVYLDTVRDGDDGPRGLQKNSEKTSEYSFRSSASSSWLTAEMLCSAKRLRLLQNEEGIFLSLSGLLDAATCNAAAAQVAEEHADRMILSAEGKGARTANAAHIGADTRHSDTKRNNSTSISNSSDVSRRSGQVTPIQYTHTTEDQSALTPELRRLCALLNISPFVFAHTVMKHLIAKGSPSLAMDAAKCLGSETSSSATSSSSMSSQVDGSGSVGTEGGHLRGDDLSVLLEAAVTLCSLAGKQMQSGAGKGGSGGKNPGPTLETIARPFVASRDLLRGVASHCPAELIGRTLDILNGSELVLAVYERVEGASQEEAMKKSSTSNSMSSPGSVMSMNGFRINESVFTRDGILMSLGAVLGHLLRYSAMEVRRRTNFTSTSIATATGTSRGTGTVDSQGGDMAVDLNDLVCALQRSENHMLAVRVLLSSWHISGAKADLLRSSLLSLSRKVLSYREIDTSLAVACLVMLPYDAMVRELKGAVPSIQSDFSRLRTVASVGEELARLWDQEALLLVFQGTELGLFQLIHSGFRTFSSIVFF